MGCACAKDRQQEDAPPQEPTPATLTKQPTLQRLATLRPPQFDRSSGGASPRSRSPREKTPRSDFLRPLQEPLCTFYRLGEVLKSSEGKQIIAAEYIRTGQACHIYVIQKITGFTGLQIKATLPADAERLRRLDHPHILKTLEMLQDEVNYYLVTEPWRGSLSDFFTDSRFREEALLARVMLQVFAALNYCHRLGIIHGSLTPRKILIRDKPSSDSADVKITGFGEIDSLAAGDERHFKSPEHAEGFNEKSDIWSCGVILYLFLCGNAPVVMPAETPRPSARRRSLLFTETKWGELSEEAVILLTAMLNHDPSQRPSASDCMASPWMQQYVKQLTTNTQSISRSLQKLQQSHRLNPLQETVMLFILTRVLNPREVMQYAESFRLLDRDGDGVINEEELLQGFLLILPQNEALAVTKRVLKNSGRDDCISYSSFLLASMGESKLMSPPNLRAAFDCFDRDNNGEVSLAELHTFFDISSSPEKEKRWRELIQQANRSEDEHFSYEEFATLMANINPA